MKKVMLGAALCLASFAANAADLPTRAPAPAYKAPAVIVPSTYNWTGFYIGGNVGYGWSKVDPGVTSVYQPIGTLQGSYAGPDYRGSGFIGGVQAGFNYQISALVLGVEADFSGGEIKGRLYDPFTNATSTSKIDWMTTFRGRAGFAMDRALIYGTGGLAVGHVKTTLDDFYASGTVTTYSSATHVGWTIGGGAEYAFTPNWTFRAEYLYADLGSKPYNFYEPQPPGWPQISGKASVTTSIARIGTNFKF